jgi:hypothetical protein
MQAWMDWAQRAGDAVVDLGSPLGVVDPAGDEGDPIGGYSILQADSAEALSAVLEGHPHTTWGGTIETLEILVVCGPAPTGKTRDSSYRMQTGKRPRRSTPCPAG